MSEGKGQRVAAAVEQAAADAAAAAVSLADLRAQHKPVQATVRVPMRADLIDEIAQLEERIGRERKADEWENRDPVAPQLAARIRELEDELAASEVVFTFRAIGRRDYAKLITDNPPTDEQKAEAESAGFVLPFNPDTFYPALMHAMCVSPVSTLEDWLDVWDNWSDGQVAQLRQACLNTQQGSVDVGPKSVIASAILDGSAKNSTTARR